MRQIKFSLVPARLDIVSDIVLKPGVVQNHPAIVRIKRGEDGIVKGVAVCGDWRAVLVGSNSRGAFILQECDVGIGE
jgi:hypothetical protein